jgi:hypothetical protein
MRGNSTKHLFHAWVEHADHHLLKHAQESRMMPTQHGFRGFPKSIQNLFFLLKRCGFKLPRQQNPGHLRLKVWDATSVLVERHQALHLELVNSVFQLLLLLWRKVINGDVHNVADLRHLDFN